MDTITKARKSSESLGRIAVEEGGGAVDADMRRQATSGRKQRLGSGAQISLVRTTTDGSGR